MLVQNTILAGISELLYTHDFVVVPGFGGFVSRPLMSHYSLSQDVLFPPSKSIVFNVQLKQNDGVLANWLKEEIQCDFVAATKHLEEFSVHCKMLLDTRNRLEFENLGLFYLDFEKNICFEPKADVNFLIESFGLSSVTLKELEREEPVIKPVIDTKDRFVKAEVNEQLPAKKRNYKKIATLAVGIPLIGVALLFAVSQIKTNSNSYANIFNFGNNHSAYIPVNYGSEFEEIEIKPNPAYVVDANGYAGITLFEDRHIAVNISAVKTESHTVKHIAHSISTAAKFQVVMGCFSVESNARKMIKNLAAKNVNAAISGTNAKGMFVVSCGGFDDKDSAVNMLQSIKAEHPSAWIMSQN